MTEEKTEATKTAEVKQTEATEVAKTYTQEDMDELKTEYDGRVAKLENQFTGIKKLQSETDKENNRLKNQPQSSGNTEVLEAILNALPQPKDDYGNPTISPEVLKAQAALKVAKQRDAQAKYATQIERQHQKAVEERQKMRKEVEDAGLDPDGEELALVELAWDNNNPAAARKWLDKALKKVKPKREKVKETEEEMEVRIRADVVKKLTKQDTESPSGVGNRLFTGEQLGEMTYKEWVAAGKPKAVK